ncbi:hypothetical protein CPIN18021_1108 [Campylobacter pinnipediorum subsp. caledonicus]|uniref:Uncharacterized protein n=1 Tax=Campylobacter pinnipediorum subsp. caledonicus TaxID=1874362 RepID=A0A1S6U8Y8_9BACT|nr:hypothetical protein [Campylobacter pinnipediorum]AQW87907.1 hypothetical protein CPIN18021_1108 [Campylobacter pinnipediorum subsp. caledonicus]
MKNLDETTQLNLYIAISFTIIFIALFINVPFAPKDELFIKSLATFFVSVLVYLFLSPILIFCFATFKEIVLPILGFFTKKLFSKNKAKQEYYTYKDI